MNININIQSFITNWKGQIKALAQPLLPAQARDLFWFLLNEPPVPAEAKYVPASIDLKFMNNDKSTVSLGNYHSWVI